MARAETQNAQNSTEVRPIELIPAWRTRRGEIDHALSEYGIETPNTNFVISSIFDIFDFRTTSSVWELWGRFGSVGEKSILQASGRRWECFGGVGELPGGFWECQESYGEKSFFS